MLLPAPGFPLPLPPSLLLNAVALFFALAGSWLLVATRLREQRALARLAGGLGVPTWLALARYPDWRWLMDRPDSPWYPSMRLFRQESPRDWDSVIRKMVEQLHLLLSGNA